MVVIPGLSRLLEAAGKHVTSWDDSGCRLAVEAGIARSHGRFRRWVADNPCFGQPVTLAIEVRRFKCVNPGCPEANLLRAH